MKSKDLTVKDLEFLSDVAGVNVYDVDESGMSSMKTQFRLLNVKYQVVGNKIVVPYNISLLKREWISAMLYKFMLHIITLAYILICLMKLSTYNYRSALGSLSTLLLLVMATCYAYKDYTLKQHILVSKLLK